MINKLLIPFVLFACLTLTGCAGMDRDETVGALAGAAIGGLAGSAIGSGSGQKWAIGAGAAAGAIAGQHVAKELKKNK